MYQKIDSARIRIKNSCHIYIIKNICHLGNLNLVSSFVLLHESLILGAESFSWVVRGTQVSSVLMDGKQPPGDWELFSLDNQMAKATISSYSTSFYEVSSCTIYIPCH